MAIPQDILLAYWARALEEEIGIALEIEGNREQFRTQLYDARKAAQDPSLDQIIVFSPADPAGEVWMVKKATELD